MWILRSFGLSIVLMACPTAVGQQRADLSGTWTNASLTTLNRPAGVDKLILSKTEADALVARINIAGFAPEGAPTEDFSNPDAGAPVRGGADFGVKAYDQFWVAPGEQLALVKGEFRSSYVVDPPNGRVPMRAEYASQRPTSTRYVTGVGGNEGPEAPPLSERCLIGFGNTGGPGMLSTLYNNTYQIVQAPDHVMILVEMVHDARIVPTFDSAPEARRAHRPDAMKPWLGDSVGWYEGGTLVVETINIRPEQVLASAIPVSPSGMELNGSPAWPTARSSTSFRSMIQRSTHPPGGQSSASTPPRSGSMSMPATRATTPWRAFSEELVGWNVRRTRPQARVYGAEAQSIDARSETR